MQTVVIYAAFALAMIANIINFAHMRWPSSKALAKADTVGQKVVAEIPVVEAELGVKPQ